MIYKGTKLYSILNAKCPQCHEGDLWKLPFLKAIPDLLLAKYNMHDLCPKCGLRYEREPGFWWGAMYISYALSSGTLLITAFVAKYYFDFTLEQVMLTVLGVALLGFLYNARVSRAIFINFFVSYKPNAVAVEREKKRQSAS